MKEDFAVSLIAVLSRDGFVSKETGVPWHLPADKEHFRNYTAGKCLLLGRRTYEEMLGWFTPQHRVFVLTHRESSLIGCGQPVHSVQEAVRLTKLAWHRELVVCGGGDCYAEAMPFATHLVLTRVEDELGRGVAFPVWDTEDWEPTLELRQPADEAHPWALTFSVLQRRSYDLEAVEEEAVTRRLLPPAPKPLPGRGNTSVIPRR
jgi:dihydrofolate reductase